jgi:hypothetical protein
LTRRYRPTVISARRSDTELADLAREDARPRQRQRAEPAAWEPGPEPEPQIPRKQTRKIPSRMSISTDFPRKRHVEIKITEEER